METTSDCLKLENCSCCDDFRWLFCGSVVGAGRKLCGWASDTTKLRMRLRCACSGDDVSEFGVLLVVVLIVGVVVERVVVSKKVYGVEGEAIVLNWENADC